jgi:methylated-DNA-[protein]-cysteine S-methyltransferase
MERTTYFFHFGVSITVNSQGKRITGSNLTLKRLPTSGNKDLIEILESFSHSKLLNLKQFYLELSRLSPFQKKVYYEISKIPPGFTKTYGEVARKLNTSPRAVGQALKKNPFPLLIPCHRIVSSQGIGGFSQGRLIKEKLLNFERGA